MSKLKQDVQVWYVCWRLSAVLCAGERKVKEETQQTWTEQWELGPCSVSFSTNNCSLRDFILSRIQLQLPKEEHRPGRRSPGVRVNVWTNTHTTWNKLAQSLYCLSCCKLIYCIYIYTVYISHLPLFPLRSTKQQYWVRDMAGLTADLSR